MKKKLVISLIFLIVYLIIIAPKVNANSINNIDMDVYIDSNGNATITEVWKANLTQGTEGYRPYKKLENSKISNFSVSDDSGKTYDSLPFWNTNSSFESKAYKSGINYIVNGVELCWGISSYGNRTYTLKYDISNFVTQYTDTQGIYFNFLNLDQSVSNAKISIHSDIPFSLDNSRIWAFGNNGSINFENGNIVLDSGGYLSKGQYMVALVRFESNIFSTDNQSSSSFDSVYDSAFSDVTDDSNTHESDYIINNDKHQNTQRSNGFKELLFTILSLPIMLMFNPIGWILFFWILGKIKGKEWLWGSNKRSGELDFGKYGKVLPRSSEIDYYRDIPCNKDLARAYWVCSEYSVVSERTLEQGIIGAILLKWIKEGKVTVSKTKKGLFSFKDNNYAIDLTKMLYADNEIENSLLDMMISASGSNKILEAKEFSKWSKKYYNKVNSWFYSIKYKEQSKLEEQGFITSTTEETAGMFGRTRTITVKNVNPQLREDAIQLKGLIKFLLDFSNMPEKEYFEVHLWEEYLIFAQLLGIADKVEEQFSKLYPNFNNETLLNTEITTIAVRNMAEICYKGVQAGAARASSYSHDYSGSSTSSGGGGSSYSSGGSSSGGSSGGGFR